MIGLSGLSALISIFIFADKMILSMDEVWQAFTGLSNLLPHSGQEFLFELELLVLAVLGIAGMALFLYMCIALGHLASRHRLLMSIVWYVVLSTALQVLLLMVMMGAGNAVPEPFVDLITGIFTLKRLVDAEPSVLVGTPDVAVAFRAAAYQLEHSLPGMLSHGWCLEKSGCFVHNSLDCPKIPFYTEFPYASVSL